MSLGHPLLQSINFGIGNPYATNHQQGQSDLGQKSQQQQPSQPVQADAGNRPPQIEDKEINPNIVLGED